MRKVAYVGIDFHITTISAAVFAEGEKDFSETIHLNNDDKMIRRFLSSGSCGQ